MKEKDVVRFKSPENDNEEKALMVIFEIRADRALVCDLRFSDWTVPPTNVYAIGDLEVVNHLSDKRGIK